MNTCLTHNQSYPQDGYCVYCGPPVTVTVSSAEHAAAESAEQKKRCGTCAGLGVVFVGGYSMNCGTCGQVNK